VHQGDASPDSIALGLAHAKALDVSGRSPGAIVLGADQTLSCDGMAFHKPADRQAAMSQIMLLSGRSHELHSAYALVSDGKVLAQGAASARLVIRRERRHWQVSAATSSRALVSSFSKAWTATISPFSASRF
jgi:predicted house-cleaning NTP pyrophosphatase (Maf/HAM1 superfamily)